jgi:hypothetical protein
MSVPAGLLDVFAAVMLLVAAVSATRLVIAGRAGRLGRPADPDADIDVSHLLMGVAMAGTLVAALTTLPAAAWEAVFALLTAWFAYRVLREYRGGRGLRALVSEHHAPHLLHSAAMLYMFLALRSTSPSSRAISGSTSSAAMSGMGSAGLRLPTLALLFAFLLVAYVVADLDRTPAPRALAAPHAPRLATLLGLTTSQPVLATPAGPTLAPAGPVVPATTTAPRLTPATTATLTPGPPAATSTPATSAIPGTPDTSPMPSRLLGPGVARGCRIAMGVTMAFMLIIMI